MAVANMKELLEAGAHFGHQTKKWNPRMKPYIFGERGGIHIINLEQTVPLFEKACEAITETVASGGDILFVGTKRQAQVVVADEAKRCEMHCINNRWLGGTLTNFKTVKVSIDRLKEIEAKMADGSYDKLTKKDRRQIERELAKLQKALSGIKGMEGLPKALFIIDPKKEAIAKREARRLGIRVVAITDTNCDPEGIDFPIPGNDDAIKSIRIFTRRIADACLSGLEKRQARIRAEVAAQAVSEEAGEGGAREKVIEVKTEKAKAFVSRDKPPTVRKEPAKKKVEAKPKADAAPKEESNTKPDTKPEPADG